MQRMKQCLVLTAVMLVLSGCRSITDISNESPYQEMIGQCYVLQQDMHVWEISGGCWEYGDLILFPERNVRCVEKSVAQVTKGTEITITAINKRFDFVSGSCAQLIIDIPGINIPRRDISPPVCASNRLLNWNVEMYWRRGHEINLKEEYVRPCE